MSQPYTDSRPWSSAYATAATVMEPRASPTKKNEPRSASSPGERRAPSQCASRGAERQVREGSDRTTESAPRTPRALMTSSAAAGDHSETSSVTRSGPTVNMISCATASMA